MAITAKEVNKLRQMTGAGMMDCKKALTKADGDFDAAIEELRKKGQKVSASRADRETSEGRIFSKTSEDHKVGTMISLTCETDFVAKNEEFTQLGQSIVDLAFEKEVNTIEDLNALSINGQTVKEKITDLIGKIGEKMEVKHLKKSSGDAVVPYVHANGKIGVLVTLKGDANDKSAITEAGKNVAMQIAAMNPVALKKDDVDPSIIEQEIKIGKELAIQEGKPTDLAEKIAQGRLNKFFKENTLLEQAYVKDNKLSISKYLDSVSKGLTVTQFSRITI